MPYSMITRKPVFHHQQHWCLSPPLPPTLNSHQWISLLTIIHHIIFLMAPVTPSGTWIIHHLMLPAEYAPMDYLVHMLMPPQVEENLFTQYLCPPMLPFESPIIRLCWVWCHIFQCSRTGLGTSESYGTSMHNFWAIPSLGHKLIPLLRSANVKRVLGTGAGCWIFQCAPVSDSEWQCILFGQCKTAPCKWVKMMSTNWKHLSKLESGNSHERRCSPHPQIPTQEGWKDKLDIDYHSFKVVLSYIFDLVFILITYFALNILGLHHLLKSDL